MTQGTNMVPLTLELIEEGAFKEDLDAHLLEAQKVLVTYAEKWGERTGKAKAVVEMTIEFECVEPEEGMFTITSKLKLKGPARPPKVTGGMSGYDKQQGQAVLFVKASGSIGGDPRQMSLPMEPSDVRSEAV